MRILIADSFSESHGAELARQGHQLTIDSSLSGQSLADAIACNEVLIVRSTQVDASIMDAAENLKLIIRAGAGTNTIDKAHAASVGIRVCNVPGANALAVAELALGLIIAIDRNIALNDQDLKRQIWNKKHYSKARGLAGQSLGILGLGAIGFAVAERARAFGMKVFALSKSGRTAETEKRIGDAGIVQLETQSQLLSQCDIISLHLPVTDETRGMVNSAFLDGMKAGAMLINTSRGELVDEAALLDAMQSKGIRAGLDVYQNEPGATDKTFTSDLARHLNVCGTHHIGASTDQAQVAVCDGVLKVIQSYLDKSLIYCVNHD